MKNLLHTALLMSFALLMFAGAGCSRGKVGVKGTVTLDNVPLESGTIDFNPADGKGANMGAVIKNGRYEIIGDLAVLPGKKTVHIRASRPTGKKVPAFPNDPPEKYVELIEQIIPAKYNDNTELTIVLTAGEIVEQDFHLKK